MNILALDLGTSTGWAALVDGDIYSGTQSFQLKRGESEGMKYLRFGAWLRELRGIVGKVDMIIYEQVNHRGGAATQVAYGLLTKVLEYSATEKIATTNLNLMTLKKWSTGKGNASKKDMIAEAQQRGFAPVNDDDADAILLLHWAMEDMKISGA